ncbi:S1 domain-containing post-transcriptional regulator GSP13 [Neobacillus mesonae]|uniref:S1 domain-containing post-transcriptional regulator GSP13 n=1 Tax=Neobacillus mesonae TaxID=1193713 RepID=UPI002573B881|nr:S1 domain-containing post-transcriptional regulator GSP13 [Neobacillus mesonae]MED4204692.1 S1 domain-containing post-transcriptional regulator GSP13 [Neobacillus mesonae]
MSGNIETGSIITGKVTGIQPYGAFVALDENTQGLVHISEITHGYVKDIHDHLKVGDEIKVKVLSVDEEAGKIGLSIKGTEEPSAQAARPRKPRRRQAAAIIPEGEGQQGFNTLKEKLQEWIDQSQGEDLIKK